ncbi:amidase family protein, partial [Actinomadura sp. KC345]|uniref:amidase family protein n=1 Tax=Actinomadura sp. KC345 TaxID=2530371 RepID=UPI001FB5F06F
MSSVALAPSPEVKRPGDARGARAGNARAGAPFAGVPMLVKALNDSAGLPANHGSAWVAKTGRTAAAHSTINRRLVEAGFIVVGQTSTPEFGVLSVSESAVHGITRNPWRTDLTPGGSSGGASAAVAAGMVPAAQGGDGGGSIRMPAAFCHLVGLKPTAGRISAGPGSPDRWGHSVPSVVTPYRAGHRRDPRRGRGPGAGRPGRSAPAAQGRVG